MTKEFIFRKAKINDLKEILRLNFQLSKREKKNFDKDLNLNWVYEKGKNHFKNRIIRRDSFLEIIENKGGIIGYLCGGVTKEPFLYRKTGKTAEIENMFIEEEFRGMGLGTKTIKDFISWCKKNKINYINVAASVKNKDAIKFYRKLKFKYYSLGLELKLRK